MLSTPALSFGQIGEGEAPAEPRAARSSIAPGDEITRRHLELRAAYAARLDELAAWAEQQGESSAATAIRGWRPPLNADRWAFACRPTAVTVNSDDTSDADASGAVAADEPRPAAAPDTAEWQQRFAALRREQAAALYALAEQSVAAGRASRAPAILAEVLREDPQHAEARRKLGYQQHEGRWLTPFEIRKTRDGQVWHDRFGWLPRDHVARYEAGERFYNGRWISAADEQRLRRNSRRGWDVATEHYVVHTNHSLEEGVRLAARLERLYDVWQQVFAGFLATEDQLARRFAGQAAVRSEPRRHKVVQFANRDEYVQALAREQPNIGVSTGFYLAPKREAYFFAGGDDDDSNLYHEATHQLFSESRPVARDVGRNANFWIVEGIACYMESLVERDGWCLLGGGESVRLRDARHRLLVDGFYVPLAEFATYGMLRLQQDSRLPMLYSQASGLTHFLMHDDGGRYREPLMAYLVAVYTGRDRPNTLAERTGASDAELDRRYRAFVEGLDTPGGAASP